MSEITIGDKITTINDIDNHGVQNRSLNEKIMRYKKLDDEFNMVSLKSRYTLQKINSLMEENKDENIENINLDEFNDPKNKEYRNRIMKKKIIQYYCTNKNDKDAFIPPSEGIMKKIRQFKRWQNYELFQKNGFKNYIENLLPDYKIVHNTRSLIDNKVNLVTKINIKKSDKNIGGNIPNYNYINLLPKINNHYSKNEKEKDNKNESNIFNNISNNYQKRLLRNKSMDEIVKNSFSISKINQNSFNISKFNNQNTINTNPKYKRKMSIISNNKSSSLINFLNNTKKNEKNNNSKEIKSFEDSVFCLNKSLIPMSIDKSVITTPFGGGLLHCNSIMRNKSITNLVPYYPTKRVQEKLRDYRNQRSKVIHNKDYMYHLGQFDHTFITKRRKYDADYCDYLIF